MTSDAVWLKRNAAVPRRDRHGGCIPVSAGYQPYGSDRTPSTWFGLLNAANPIYLRPPVGAESSSSGACWVRGRRIRSQREQERSQQRLSSWKLGLWLKRP